MLFSVLGEDEKIIPLCTVDPSFSRFLVILRTILMLFHLHHHDTILCGAPLIYRLSAIT